MDKPDLTAAAKEFNIDINTLTDFLREKGLEGNLRGNLTAEIYSALEGKYAENLAERRIRQCLATQNPYLDIGYCGLRDKDFEAGSQLDSLLRQCIHLRILILSNEWINLEEGKLEDSDNEQGPNQFTKLPVGLIALKNLEKLICSGDNRGLDTFKWSVKEFSPLLQLMSLKYLDVSYNQLVEISGLESFKLLEVLSLYSNQITEIKGLETLSKLKILYLYNNQLTEIKGLEKLSRLKILNLSNNQLTEIKGLKTLSKLENLYLHGNQITEIKGLETLSKLKILYLYNNQLTRIKGLEKLFQLLELYLHNNRLTEIEGLEALSLLHDLYLSDNRLTEIKGLETLSRLHKLNLSNNQLTEIKGLKTLSRLQKLDLSNNQLTEIKELETLSRLQELNLSDNGLTEIKGLEFILNKNESFNLHIQNNPFLRKYRLNLKPYENHLRFIKELMLRQNSTGNRQRFIYPLKVLMLGNHGVGKSSLVNYLTSTKTKISSTHILRIENYWLQTSDKNGIPDVIFYDFGGQDFYHGLYRAFISTGSLQIIVFDINKDKNDLDEDSDKNNIINYNRQYWLGQKSYKERNKEPDQYIMVQTFAGEENTKEVPLLSHIGKGYLMSFFLSFPEPESEQSKMEDPFFKIGRSYFEAFFEKKVHRHQETNTIVETQWYIDFIQFILDKKRNRGFAPTGVKSLIADHYKVKSVITDDYKVKKLSFTEKLSYLKTSLERLHRHGLVLYYREKELEDIVWLNPEALVQYVQENILPKDKMSSYKGVVKEQDFEKFAKDTDILRMLQRQKVIFLHQPDKSRPEINEYIIPNYLPLALENDPDYRLSTFGLGRPDFIIKFNDFIPFGFINQMICFYGKQPDTKKFWRNQLLFTISNKTENSKKDRVARILIRLDFSQLSIKVHLQLLSDSQFEKREITEYLFFSLIALYRDEIDDQHVPDYDTFHTYKNKVETRTGNKSQPGIAELFGLPPGDTYISTNIDKIQKDILQKVYEKPDYVPEDVYLSTDNSRYIYYKDLIELKREYRIKSYSIKEKDSRINKEDVKEISVNPFAAFTSNRLSLMKNVFISYSHNDAEYLATLRTYLINLEREGLIQTWQDGLIQAGDDWDQKIKEGLKNADICIMLLSQSFIASNYVHEVEFRTIMEKRQIEDCRIIPVLIKDCDWKNWKVYPKNVGDTIKNKDNKDYAIGTFQFLPHDNAKLLPLYRWTHPEEAWMQVIDAIREFVKVSNV